MRWTKIVVVAYELTQQRQHLLAENERLFAGLSSLIRFEC